MKKLFAISSLLAFLCFLSGCAGAIHGAAAKGDVKTVREMLDSGADINDISISATVWGTPLHFASKECQVAVVKLLLEKNVDVNMAAGNISWTALRFAADSGCNEVVKLLLDKGAEIGARDRFGTTPLMAAAIKGQRSTVQLLVERGADVDYAIGRLMLREDKNSAQIVELAVKGQLHERMRSSANIEQALVANGKLSLADALSSKAVLPQIKSEVDQLPAVMVKANKNAYAIVVGIESYRQKLPRADFATQDAKLVADYLTKSLGYPEENVVTLLNDHASNVDLVKYFEKWLPNNVEIGSTVSIYYSGHGAPDLKTGGAYLVPYDGDPSFIAETGYSLKRMYDALGKLPAKRIIVALDSCFSGAGGRSVLAKGARPLIMNLQSSMTLSKNMTVLSASSGEQISSTYDEKGHGLFTYFMLKGIKNEDVVRQDGSIKMDDLFGYIKPQVERIARKQYNNEQTPQLIGAK